jgi:hypothetical protein
LKNTAFDFGTGKSYDVISIVQQMKKCSVSEALKYLSTFDFSMQNESLNAEMRFQTSYKILEIKEIQHPALIQYLKSRKVFEQKHLIKEIHYELEGKNISESVFRTIRVVLKLEILILKFVWE